MLDRTLLLALLVVISGCDTCNRASVSPSGSASLRTPHTASPEDAQFEPPGSDGWGRAGSLRFLERTLGGGDATRPLPLVVMIHGLGDKPSYDWFSAAGSINTPIRLIMPQAPTPYHGGFAWFSFRVGDSESDELAQGITRAADELSRSIKLLRARRPTVGAAIVTGFSQGGMLSYALALRHPTLVALSHPISGMLPRSLWPKTKPPPSVPPIVAMHGVDDQVVPIAPAQALRAHLDSLGYEISLRELPGVRHQITSEMAASTAALLEDTARTLTEEQ